MFKMKASLNMKANWKVFSVLIAYPLFLVLLGLHYFLAYGLSKSVILFFICGYYVSNITVGVAIHRMWSHNAFKTSKVVEFIFALLSAYTLQGPVLAWASDHYRHHTYTDTDKDPHSPSKFRSKFLGFLWSHIGWMLFSESTKSIDRVTLVKLGRNKILIWQLKYYWYIAGFMSVVVPVFLGYVLSGTLFGGYVAFVFIGLGRALQQQMTFCVNSLCHFVGTKKYQNGTAGDIWWMALFLLGENWHNFHHAFPSDYRNGAKWYQFDVHKWIIFVMSKIGLAWDLDVTPLFRIEAKVSETAAGFNKSMSQQFSNIKDKLLQIVNNVSSKLKELDNSSYDVKNKLRESFIKLSTSVDHFNKQIEYYSQAGRNTVISEKVMRVLSNKISDLEESASKVFSDFEKMTKQYLQY